jgi:ATP-dependent Lhr-like helicase
MASRDAPLDLFHPLIRKWFAERVGEPTEVQRLAWPRIAAGEHVLVTAPTGSGKTLAAFLWALDRLISGELPGGQMRVLYVSPLRALNNDIRRNLLAPLEELRTVFTAAGELMPEVRVFTRSGDTPAEERARMARRPPEILITTPESLNILLTSRRGRAMLSGIATVILD